MTKYFLLMAQDQMKAEKNFGFYIDEVSLEVSSVEAEDPKVNKVKLSVPEFMKTLIPSGYVSFNPKKEIIETVRDENGVKMESPKTVQKRKSELDEIFSELMDATTSLAHGDLVRIEGTITKATNEDENMEFDEYYFINPNHLGTLEASIQSVENVDKQEFKEQVNEKNQSKDSEKSEEKQEQESIL